MEHTNIVKLCSTFKNNRTGATLCRNWLEAIVLGHAPCFYCDCAPKVVHLARCHLTNWTNVKCRLDKYKLDKMQKFSEIGEIATAGMHRWVGGRARGSMTNRAGKDVCQKSSDFQLNLLKEYYSALHRLVNHTYQRPLSIGRHHCSALDANVSKDKGIVHNANDCYGFKWTSWMTFSCALLLWITLHVEEDIHGSWGWHCMWP